MPTVTEDKVDGFAHCPLPRCPGGEQEQVNAIRRETAHTYREREGDAPGVEQSFVDLVFQDETDIPCPACGHPRDLTDQRRKTYAALSGHDPMGLLGVERFDPEAQAERLQELKSQGIDPDKQRLEDENAALLERVARLEADPSPREEN